MDGETGTVHQVDNSTSAWPGDMAAVAAELERLRADFPGYCIGSVTTWGHTRYLGQDGGQVQVPTRC